MGCVPIFPHFPEDGQRLPNKRKLWQTCGIGIRRHESAGKGTEGASRQGNRRLKTILMIAPSIPFYGLPINQKRNGTGKDGSCPVVTWNVDDRHAIRR